MRPCIDSFLPLGSFAEPLKSFKNSCGPLSTANAHRDHTVPGSSPLHLSQDACSELGTRTSKRMSKRDRTAIYVQPLEVEIQFLDHGQRLNRKSLIELNQSDVVELQ